MSGNNRGWTWLDNGSGTSTDDCLTEEEMESRTPVLDELARRWSALENAREQAYFCRQNAFEAGENDGPDFDSQAEHDAYELRVTVTCRLEQAQVDAIETEMYELGARIMRPYEHHNEMESYYEYAERDRD